MLGSAGEDRAGSQVLDSSAVYPLLRIFMNLRITHYISYSILQRGEKLPLKTYVLSKSIMSHYIILFEPLSTPAIA
jgi:hypothetical protein